MPTPPLLSHHFSVVAVNGSVGILRDGPQSEPIGVRATTYPAAVCTLIRESSASRSGVVIIVPPPWGGVVTETGIDNLRRRVVAQRFKEQPKRFITLVGRSQLTWSRYVARHQMLILGAIEETFAVATHKAAMDAGYEWVGYVPLELALAGTGERQCVWTAGEWCSALTKIDERWRVTRQRPQVGASDAQCDQSQHSTQTAFSLLLPSKELARQVGHVAHTGIVRPQTRRAARVSVALAAMSLVATACTLVAVDRVSRSTIAAPPLARPPARSTGSGFGNILRSIAGALNDNEQLISFEWSSGSADIVVRSAEPWRLVQRLDRAPHVCDVVLTPPQAPAGADGSTTAVPEVRLRITTEQRKSSCGRIGNEQW